MSGPLYKTEAEIARAVLGPGRTDEWRGWAVILEREGLPKPDSKFGRRYWPAVRAWLDVWNRVDKIAAAPPRRAGRETWPTKSKPQASTGEPARPDNVRHIGQHPRTT